MIGDLYTFKGRTVRVLKRWGKPDPLNPVLERGWRGGDLIDGEYRPKPRKKTGATERRGRGHLDRRTVHEALPGHEESGGNEG
jgi:hypothetical protein